MPSNWYIGPHINTVVKKGKCRTVCLICVMKLGFVCSYCKTLSLFMSLKMSKNASIFLAALLSRSPSDCVFIYLFFYLNGRTVEVVGWFACLHLM